MVSVPRVQDNSRQAFVTGIKQWDAMMYMAKNCPHVRGFSYIAPDSIVLQISGKCPFMKFNERLQKAGVLCS